MQSSRGIRYLVLAGIALLALIGAGAIFYATVWGPWAFSDSAGYLAAARNLLAGRGFGWYNPNGSFVPFSYYPAFYPLLLTLPGLLGMDLVSGARLLDILLFAILIAVSCFAAYRFLPHGWPTIGLGLLILCSVALLDDYSSMMSEPVFITTGFTGLAILLFYLERPNWVKLIMAAVFTALAMISRYIGFTFLLAGLVGLILLNPRPWKQRFLPAILYAVIAFLPTLINQLWVYLQIGKLGNRTYGMGTFLERFKAYVDKVIPIFNNWIPYAYRINKTLSPHLTVIALALLGLVLLGWVWLRLHSNPRYNGLLRYAMLMATFCLVYVIFLGISYATTIPSPEIDNRMLSPLLPALFATAVGLLVGVTESLRGSRWTHWMVFLLILIAIRFNQPQAAELIKKYHTNGAGYTASIWHNSATFAALEALPSQTPVISNDPGLMLFYLNRLPYDLKFDQDWSPDAAIHPFGSSSDPLESAFRNGAALVIIMPAWRSTFSNNASSALLSFTSGLIETYSNPEYHIYYFRQPSS